MLCSILRLFTAFTLSPHSICATTPTPSVVSELVELGLPNVIGNLVDSYLYNEISIFEILTKDMLLRQEQPGQGQIYSYEHPSVPVFPNTLLQLGTLEEINGPIYDGHRPTIHFIITLPNRCIMTEAEVTRVQIQYWNQDTGGLDHTLAESWVHGATIEIIWHTNSLIAPQDTTYELILPKLPDCTQPFALSATYLYPAGNTADKPMSIHLGTNSRESPLTFDKDVVRCREFNVQDLELCSPFQSQLTRFHQSPMTDGKFLLDYISLIDYHYTTTGKGGKVYLGSTEELLSGKNVFAMKLWIHLQIVSIQYTFEQVFRVRVLAYDMDNGERVELEDWTIIRNDLSQNSIQSGKIMMPSDRNLAYWLILPPLAKRNSYVITVEQQLLFDHRPQGDLRVIPWNVLD